MSEYSVTDWTGKRKNIVFIGESGCGKSELSIHFALELAKQKKGEVHLFDMDQTKPLFRARDLWPVLERAGVKCHAAPQILDTPTVADGIMHFLDDAKSYVILDVGGNETGARLIGGLASKLSGENTAVGYLVNPYRPWSKDISSMNHSMAAILAAARISDIQVIASPSLGRKTTAAEFIEGIRRLLSLEERYGKAEFAVVMDSLYETVRADSLLPLIPIHLYMKYPWEEG